MKHKGFIAQISLLLLLLLLMSAGCTVGPDYVRPPVSESLPTAFKELEGWKLAQPETARSTCWWEVYQDPVLNHLAEQVAAANFDVAVAAAQFRQARALVKAARAGALPTLSSGFSATRSRSSENLGSARPGGIEISTFQLPIDLSWELDIWGRVRRGVEASEGNAEASAADLAAITLHAQAELASAYFQLRLLDAQQQLLDATTAVYQQSYDITKHQYDAGAATQADVLQAETQLQSTTAQALDTGVLRAQLEHAIALLIGKPPAAFTLPVTALNVQIPLTPPGLPSELLERRPDIAAAERVMAAANAQIGFAEAAFYPTVQLSATAGLSASRFADWFEWPSRFWSIGPAAALSLFDGGARQAQSEQAKAAYQATVASYRGVVLNAFREVEDNLAALRILEEESVLQEQAVQSARQVVTLTNEQFQAGSVAYLNVLIAQTAALANELTALNLLQRRLFASVLLIKALGGDWQKNSCNAEITGTSKN